MKISVATKGRSPIKPPVLKISPKTSELRKVALRYARVYLPNQSKKLRKAAISKLTAAAPYPKKSWAIKRRIHSNTPKRYIRRAFSVIAPKKRNTAALRDIRFPIIILCGISFLAYF